MFDGLLKDHDMKAILSTAAGGPDTLVLQEIADPTAGPGQIVVRIKASGVNYPDTLIIEDRYQFKPPRPFSPGGEFSGIVESIGEDVKTHRLGDRVMGFSTWGSMAQKISVNANHCLAIPDVMPVDVASAFILTYGTSYYALRERGELKPGETLLVLGAAGGVGLAAIELGKVMGARVVAAVSTAEKAVLAREHGADNAMIYPGAPFDDSTRKEAVRLFKEACGPGRANVICDAVGGDYSEAALRAIAWEGRFLVVGFPAGIPQIPLNLPLLKSCQIVGVFWGAWLDRHIDRFGQGATELLDWYQSGKLRPHISAQFPFDKAGDAIAHLAARKALGKVVVNID
jgi:NADPH2:quinone reductase